MEMVSVLFSQIVLMFLFMAVGFILSKTGLLKEQGVKDMANVLLYAIIPVVVFKSFLIEFSPENLKIIGLSTLFGFSAILFSAIISKIAFRRYPIEHFGTSFSNAGFLGVPLVTATFGESAVIFVAPFVAFIGLFQWTYGVYAITKDKSQVSVKKILTNPNIIAFVLGVIFFFLPVELPKLALNFINGIAGCNAPVAMIIVGTYLTQIPFKEFFTGHRTYFALLARNFLIPLLTIFLLWLIPAEYLTMRQAILVVASCSIGSNTAIFAKQFNKDYLRATKEICLSTLACILSIPLIFMIANLLWTGK